MVDFFKQLLLSRGLDYVLALDIAMAAAVLAILLISVLSYLLAKKVVLRIVKAIILRSKSKWDDVLLQNKVFERVIGIIPPLVIHIFAPVFPGGRDAIQKAALCAIVFVVVMVLDKLFDSIDDIYRHFEVSKSRPIKGFLQVLKILSYIVGLIVIVSALLGSSPWVLLSGLGAATAVLLLVFQNSILGFVAGVQLSANNMVQLGDWIEMPKFGADGDVIEISLHTVKVQNWDKTITTIPTQAMVSESFKNWRGMQESGGRRIKRAIHLDMTSVRFCTEEMLERFGKIQYIQEYLYNKQNEVESYNREQGVDSSSVVNGRHLTNLGTLRAYIQQYLEHHPGVHKGMTRLTRQLEPTQTGLPLEIYVFANTTAWADYEGIQADIFDHILAVIPEFDLRVFQYPTGQDLGRQSLTDENAPVS